MPKTEYKYIVIDKVEDSEIDGKPAKVAIDKEGFSWHFASHLQDKFNLLVPNAKLQLLMDKTEIKSFATMHSVMQDRYPDNKPKYVKNQREASIEAQVATYNITDLIIHDKEVPDDIKNMYWNWLRKAYSNGEQNVIKTT